MKSNRPFLTSLVDCLVTAVSWMCSPLINKAVSSWDVKHVRQVEDNTEDIQSLQGQLDDVHRRIRRLEEIRRNREGRRSGGATEQLST